VDSSWKTTKISMFIGRFSSVASIKFNIFDAAFLNEATNVRQCKCCLAGTKIEESIKYCQVLTVREYGRGC